LASGADQRGSPRPIDELSVSNVAGGDGSDVGACEYLPEPDGIAMGLLALAALGSAPSRRVPSAGDAGRST